MNFISVRLHPRLPLVVHRAYRPHLCRGYIVSIEPKRAYFALKTYLRGKWNIWGPIYNKKVIFTLYRCHICDSYRSFESLVVYLVEPDTNKVQAISERKRKIGTFRFYLYHKGPIWRSPIGPSHHIGHPGVQQILIKFIIAVYMIKLGDTTQKQPI